MCSRLWSLTSLMGLATLALTGGTAGSETGTGIDDGFHCDFQGAGNFTNTLTASTIASSGKTLAAFMIWTEADSFYRVKHGEDLVYAKHAYGNADNITMDITFGPNSYSGVSGMSHKYNGRDKTLTGTIDGQAIAPFQMADSLAASDPKMADGRPVPTAKLIADLKPEDFTALNDKIKSINKTCGEATTFPKPIGRRGTIDTRDLFARDGLDRSYSSGYTPNTYNNAGCISCEVGVQTAYATAMTICIGSSAICALTFGLSCAICWAAAAAEIFAGNYACMRSSACCPTACQPPGFFGNSQCCFQGETCLNSVIGLCCKADEKTCGGKSCCHDSQICIGSGNFKGTCCPPEATCNNGLTCCKDGTQCFNGNTCCAKEKQCGSNCCKDGPGGAPFDLGFCANKKTGLCCTGKQVEANGICCNPGEKNVNGQCIDPRGKCRDRPACDFISRTNTCGPKMHCEQNGCCADTIF